MLNKHRDLNLITIGSLAILVCLVAAVSAQQMKIYKSGAGGGFLIAELVTFIGLENNQLIVTDRMPIDRLSKEYQAVDIRKGDIIMMANGKKVTKPDELEKLYEGLAVGQEMKFGLKRGSEMLMASFKKADPSTLPMMKRVVRIGDGSAEGGEAEGVAKGITINGDPIPLLEIGVLFAAKDGKITVGDVLPVPGVSNLRAEPKAGDLFVSLQGTEYTTADALQKAWDGIPVGDTVRLVLSREGKQTLSVFAKPKAMGEVMLQKAK